MNICVNCWKKTCKCSNMKIEDIDKNMIEILQVLNSKGYKTRFCCGGHKDCLTLQIYIQFVGIYKFKNVPKGMKKFFGNKLGNSVTTIEYCNSKLSGNVARQGMIDEINFRLYEWVYSLPQYKEENN